MFVKFQKKCGEYWPAESKKCKHGSISITNTQEQKLPDFIIRELKVDKVRNNVANNIDSRYIQKANCHRNLELYKYIYNKMYCMKRNNDITISI
jgi:hypothetical protein